MSESWDWNKALPIDEWHKLCLAGWPGWDKDPASGEPWGVFLVVRKGQGGSSRDMAVEWDDLSAAPFYYRDWTDSGLPFVEEGEAYRSGFWFARRADRDAFLQRFGGSPCWPPQQPEPWAVLEDDGEP